MKKIIILWIKIHTLYKFWCFYDQVILSFTSQCEECATFVRMWYENTSHRYLIEQPSNDQFRNIYPVIQPKRAYFVNDCVVSDDEECHAGIIRIELMCHQWHTKCVTQKHYF